MSESSFGSDSKATKKHEEELDDDVEQIDVADSSARLRGILVQLLLSLFVLGCMTGALIWSFNNGEKGTDNGAHKARHDRDAEHNFTIFVDEFSATGFYRTTYRNIDGPNVTEIVQEYESFWYQNDRKQLIVHRLDNTHTIYVRSNGSYYVTQHDVDGPVQLCKFYANYHYEAYIRSLGLIDMERFHSDIERTKNHAEVYIYEGDPSQINLIAGGNNMAFLVAAYADAGTGALLGWDTYFESIGQKNYLFLASYWYDAMTPTTPNDDVFALPKECSPWISAAARSNRLLDQKL